MSDSRVNGRAPNGGDKFLTDAEKNARADGLTGFADILAKGNAKRRGRR